MEIAISLGLITLIVLLIIKSLKETITSLKEDLEYADKRLDYNSKSHKEYVEIVQGRHQDDADYMVKQEAKIDFMKRECRKWKTRAEEANNDN